LIFTHPTLPRKREGLNIVNAFDSRRGLNKVSGSGGRRPNTNADDGL